MQPGYGQSCGFIRTGETLGPVRDVLDEVLQDAKMQEGEGQALAPSQSIDVVAEPLIIRGPRPDAEHRNLHRDPRPRRAGRCRSLLTFDHAGHYAPADRDTTRLPAGENVGVTSSPPFPDASLLPGPFNLAAIGAGLTFAESLGDLGAALQRGAPGGVAVVQAPPGTGKTTLVPPLVANYADAYGPKNR